MATIYSRYHHYRALSPRSMIYRGGTRKCWNSLTFFLDSSTVLGVDRASLRWNRPLSRTATPVVLYFTPSTYLRFCNFTYRANEAESTPAESARIFLRPF